MTLASVNLSTVKLKLLRLSERNLVPWSRDSQLGQALERYRFESQTENGKIVWEGTADIPHWQPNQVDAHRAAAAGRVRRARRLHAAGDAGRRHAGIRRVARRRSCIRTDLAPTVWRGSDGLTVQVRSFADAQPRPGVELRLLARSNDILAEATTDADGVARFAAPLLRGTGPQAPQSLHGDAGDDFVALDLTTAAFDLSDRGVEGAPQPGPLDAFAWTDRGIYRPGETVQVMALLRDAAGQPEDVPAHVVVKRPNGQVFLDQVPPRGGDASICLPVALSLSAPAGEWTVEVLADPKRRRSAAPGSAWTRSCPTAWRSSCAAAGPIVPGPALPAAGHGAVPVRRAGGEPDRQGHAAAVTATPTRRRRSPATASGSTARCSRPTRRRSTCRPPTRRAGRRCRSCSKSAPDTTRPGAGRARRRRSTTRPAGRATPRRRSRSGRPAT